ncbi:MAG: VOC family protein [Actinomycetes bacterium]|jgi:lactoylglutathione lyase|nr:VOC family protein [Actinomycetes bacterium]
MTFTAVHTCIKVVELERSIAFYRAALGLEPVREIAPDDGSWKIVFLQNADSDYQIELTWNRDHAPYELGENPIHIAFRTDDIDAALARHRELGCVGFENKEMGIYFISDPDGYQIEIIPERS